jgi:hypothetical protein
MKGNGRMTSLKGKESMFTGMKSYLRISRFKCMMDNGRRGIKMEKGCMWRLMGLKIMGLGKMEIK